MDVFLTGGTGFIGSHIAGQLVDQDHRVVAMVRATSDTAHLERLGVELVESDLQRVHRLEEPLLDVDAVIHVAGLTGAPNAETLYEINADGTRRLVDRVADMCGDDTRFIYTSSVSAQGPSQGKTPRKTELTPSPVSHYGRSKLDGEGAVLAHRDELAVTILRPPVVYGPRDRDMFEVFQLANRRLAPVIGGRERWLSVIHGEDVASAVIACLDAAGDGEIYPIDDGGAYTWEQLGDLIADAVGKSALTIPIPGWLMASAATIAEIGGSVLDVTATFNRDKYREMCQPGWVCGHERIRRDLGWEPKWTLADGARQTAQWYRDHDWL